VLLIVDSIPADYIKSDYVSSTLIQSEEVEESEKNRNFSAFKSKILIVEDDYKLREFINDELKWDYQIFQASNGETGFNTAREILPDLIISDVMMEKMDGIEMCKKIKNDLITSHIPVILLTARHAEYIIKNSFDIGADDFITKPFNISLLKTRILNLIEQRKKLRKLFASGNETDISKIVPNNMDNKFLVKLKATIENNMDNPELSPVSLASEMALSKMQLYRKVSALTNQTVYNYIRTIRIKKAARLLLTTNMQIAEVAYAVGFPYPSNFTKCFTKEFNQTPSDFIKSNIH